ncbi:hypothetical protein TNCV_3548001 [Trichonephila clavipes]|nr:hypothetical protein TNCV_3548001 [Trichonephila clavipes]
MLAEAGDSLERQSLKNAWNKLWPDLEGEKDFNDDYREEFTDFVQSIPGFQECDEDNPEETEEDEDNNNNESSKGPSNADAFYALETAMEWYEQQAECSPTQLLLLKRIRDRAAKKRKCTMIQRKISDYFPQ